MAVLPIAIVLPHPGRDIPPELSGRIALTPEQIFNEADVYTDLIYDFQDQVLHWVRFPYARAILDMNRPDDPNQTRPGDGIVKRQTSYGDPVFRPGHEPDPALERTLIDRYWRPWHQQLAAIAADKRVKWVIDAHSMAAIGPGNYDDPGRTRPRVSAANFGNEQGEAGPFPLTAPPSFVRTLATRLGEALADLPGLAPTGRDFAINSPFYGGYDLQAHGSQPQPWLMIELNRALYIGEQEGNSPIVPADPGRIQLLRQRIWQTLLTLNHEWSAGETMLNR